TAHVTICHFVNGEVVEETIASENVRPGDIVKVLENHSVPADMVILWTSMYENGNQCYIETSNIDGETNLKVRQVRAETAAGKEAATAKITLIMTIVCSLLLWTLLAGAERYYYFG